MSSYTIITTTMLVSLEESVKVTLRAPLGAIPRTTFSILINYQGIYNIYDQS